MSLSKRERVIRALELDEPDKVPIYYGGFEKSCSTYQEFLKSDEYNKCKMVIRNNFSPFKYKRIVDITELRFWNVMSFIIIQSLFF
ncbi:MAG: hypothetical protein GY870_00270 [archaeon]|nr:hypothetical protein [archaeon]